MNHLKPLGLCLLSCFSLAMTACQTIPKAPEPIEQTQHQQDHFTLQGKLGVRTPQQSGSAFFVWQQENEQYNIELSGILGLGKTLIQGDQNGVQLNSSKTGLIEARTPEELLFRATGWNAPITHLRHWVQGKPATLNATLRQDSAQRHTFIEEDQWVVELSYANADTRLPQRLILTQALAQGENRITMVIQQRQ